MANKKTKLAIEVGAGLLAAGAAGYYFFASEGAKKNRKIAVSWASKLKKDVEKNVETLKSMDKNAVTKVIAKVADGYEGVKGVSAKDLSAAAQELKKNWEKLVKVNGKTKTKTKAKAK